MNKPVKTMLFAIILLLVVGVALIILLWYGVLLFNTPSSKKYPVRGVDVSAYQGEIDWQTLSAQGIDFVFIKATEGSSYVDSRFQFNFSEAQKTNLRVGAYHFFSFDSGGTTQAENFIGNVPKIDSMLPPVVDFEFYGDWKNTSPNKDEALSELNILLSLLEQYYGMKPILYATEEIYFQYLDKGYEDYDLWIRNVLTRPDAKIENWTFWQYTNREKLPGYSGPEIYIDMNVFNGTKEDFEIRFS